MPETSDRHRVDWVIAISEIRNWGKNRFGKWLVMRSTAKDRFRRALKRISEWCRDYRHYDVREQWQALSRKLRGHFAYFGIVGNYEALDRFRYGVRRAWRRWLDKRSQRARMNWDRMQKLLDRYPLPRPRIVHPR